MDTRMSAVEDAVLRHDAWHVDISQRMAALEKNTAEVLDLMNSWRGAMKVLGWLFKPITAIMTLASALALAYFTAFPKK